MIIDTITTQTSVEVGISNITTYVEGCIPNTAPTMGDVLVDIEEGGRVVFVENDFNQTFSDNEGNDILDIQILSAPKVGTLSFDGDPITINQIVAFQDISRLTYIPIDNQYGIEYAIFTFRVRDNGVPPNEWSNVASVGVNVDKINTEPIVSDNEVDIVSESMHIFTVADFTLNYFDEENDSLGYVTVNSLPNSTTGQLFFQNTLVSLTDLPLTVTVANLTIGDLRFVSIGPIGSVELDFDVFDNIN